LVQAGKTLKGALKGAQKKRGLEQASVFTQSQVQLVNQAVELLAT
jgi:hypothetical protein